MWWMIGGEDFTMDVVMNMARAKTEITPEERDKYIKIGLNIAYYRKVAGMSQEQLAELVGMSRQHIGHLEAPNMVVKPSLDTLFRIAKALRIEDHKLLMYRE
jgi:Predicted transcriptional regulators